MNPDPHPRPLSPADETLLRFLEKPQPIVSHPVDPPSPPGDCPTAEMYMRVAMGTLDTENAKEETERLLAHAACCPPCGDRLSHSLQALEGNPSPEETAAIAELASVRIDWQRQLAREMAATPTRKRPHFPKHNRWSRLWMAGAIAATLLLAAFLVIRYSQRNSPENLLARAYTQARNLELRIPLTGAEIPFVPMTEASHTRGNNIGHEPAALLDAQAKLARELEKAPENLHWQQLQARADLLAEHYDTAIDTLDRLLATGPVTADLLVDAAAAYYQRGLLASSESDRNTALDYLSRADEIAPTDPVVLFNEAIVMEDRRQLINAVEVWNRYLIVERDERWASEGKRKLAALEQTLNRLKSHQSRIQKMLATPESLDSLRTNAPQLAQWDEELSTLQLHTLTQMAFPVPTQQNQSAEQSRGSPCNPTCLAARRLLTATARSLQLQHHDPWLADLLAPGFDSLPPGIRTPYAQALDKLGQATNENQVGKIVDGKQHAAQAFQLFQQLARAHTPLSLAAHVGQQRAAIEYLFSLQRLVDFNGCRQYFQQQSPLIQHLQRYPWIQAQAQLIEEICDDTPETQIAARRLIQSATRLATESDYPLLLARAQSVRAQNLADAGEIEAAQQLSMATLRTLMTLDPPPIRIAMTMDAVNQCAVSSSLAHNDVLTGREAVRWMRIAENYPQVALELTNLAQMELRIGAHQEAQRLLQLSNQESQRSSSGKAAQTTAEQITIILANSELEYGDLAAAQHDLDKVTDLYQRDSDVWASRIYNTARGQLYLASGQLDKAAQTLEADIRASEGNAPHLGDSTAARGFAEQDHDIYAELAATWLAQGRSPASVLALWERYRLRVHGLPIPLCPAGKLDCTVGALLARQKQLGNSILTGQILLLDRILIYRMDQNQILWSQKPIHRQDVLSSTRSFEHVISSPATTPAAANRLGVRLAEALLPALLAPDSSPASNLTPPTILIEPDLMLGDLAWAALPTQGQPLGIRYPLTEIRSILANPSATTRAAHIPDTSPSPTLIIGASISPEGEPPLPEVLTEARAITRFLRAPQVLLGQQATTQQVAAYLGSSALLHFAGHAIHGPNGTDLMLAAASPSEKTPWMDSAFFRQHPPRACQLAVLSACSTGRHVNFWNNPLQDVVDTLTSLGVPEVVATRWQVDSAASVPFMDAFYRNLAQGDTVPMALTAARRVLFSQSPYNSPYHWAAYYSSGSGITRIQGVVHASRENDQQARERQLQPR